MKNSNIETNIETVLEAYKQGLFPMANSRNSSIYHWYDPPQRALLPIHHLHIPRRLQKTILKSPYKLTINTAFNSVIESCADKTSDRPTTWINDGIITLFCKLHKAGHAHSVEAWDRDRLVGGIYGLSVGTAFMGESMFSRARDASKICLVLLCARLWSAGFEMFDAQFVNKHLEQFGVYEISRDTYLGLLKIAADKKPKFNFYNPTADNTKTIRDYFSGKG